MGKNNGAGGVQKAGTLKGLENLNVFWISAR
jgi:hypothetical protein